MGKAIIVVFGSVDTTHSVSVPIVDDTGAEGAEQFRVTLIPATESVSITAGRGEAIVEIADNDRKSLLSQSIVALPVTFSLTIFTSS